MSKNSVLTSAKIKKNNEFYTQYKDVEREMEAYAANDPKIFRDKTILCPCDDPEWSSFTKYFLDNFERHGIRKLVSTCIATNKEQQISLFSQNSVNDYRGRILIADNRPEKEPQISLLKGNGDFRSEEITKLRDEADMIITNPPFSLFSEFLAWVMEAKKSFSIIGNKNALTAKDVFPLLKDEKIWLGYRFMNDNFYMIVPKGEPFDKEERGTPLKMIMSCWYTNIDHERRHRPVSTSFTTMEENLKKEKLIKKCRARGWVDPNGKPYLPHLDNYPEVIEIPFVECIPSDYNGVMAVPITYMGIHNPEEYEILNANDFRAEPVENKSSILLTSGRNSPTEPENRKVYGSYEDMVARPTIKGRQIYRRIFIKKI